MESKTHTQSIDGHTYEILLHPAEEGWPLAAEVLAMGAEPFTRIIEAWLKTSKDLEEGLDLPEIMKALDWGEIGADFSSLMRTLATRPDLVQRLFAHTSRDGKALSATMVFDDAYRGNYKEMGQALVAIVKANGFIPFSF